jgi:DNA mismatch endonuclease (patch repair protein)
MDHISKDKRSWNMSRIQSKNTKPELIVRKLLSGKKIKYRLHNSTLPGKPDISIKKYKLAVFINGCFWHGHNCKRGNIPKSNIDYWKNKILTNIKRDKKNHRLLKKEGWTVFVIWECNIKNEKLIKRKIDAIESYITNMKMSQTE